MQHLADKAEIAEIINNWAVWNDSGNWDRLATCWHADGWMTATLYAGPATRFIEINRERFDKGTGARHLLGGISIDIVGQRAIAQTKVTIVQRGLIEGTPVDVTCIGRFYDFFEKRSDHWGLVRRQPIYELDRMDVADPGATLKLDGALLDRYPSGYRHIAYVQTKLGFVVNDHLPGLKGPAVARLYAEGQAWLDGAPTPFAKTDLTGEPK